MERSLVDWLQDRPIGSIRGALSNGPACCTRIHQAMKHTHTHRCRGDEHWLFYSLVNRSNSIRFRFHEPLPSFFFSMGGYQCHWPGRPLWKKWGRWFLWVIITFFYSSHVAKKKKKEERKRKFDDRPLDATSINVFPPRNSRHQQWQFDVPISFCK